MTDVVANPNNVSPPTGHQPVAPQPTTSSMTSVIIPAAAPTPPARGSYTDWDNVVWLFGGLVALIILVGQISSAGKNIAEWFDRKKKKDQEQDAPLESRIRILEDSSKTFRPKEDLDERFRMVNDKIDHEKENRRMVQDGFENKLRGLSDAQAQDRLAMTEIKGEVKTLSSNSQRVEEAVDSLRVRVDERFDRLHDAIVNKPK